MYVIAYGPLLHFTDMRGLTPLGGDEPLGLLGRAVDQVGDVGGRLAPLPEHVGGDDVGVRGVRAPDADAHPVEVRAAELALERLQPVVAGQAAAQTHPDVAERQVDLVVDDDDAVEVELVGAAGGADGAAGLVHVGLRAQDGDARAAGAGAPLAQLTGELLLGLGQVPAPSERLGDLEADVVRALGVRRARVAQPDDQPVDGRGPEELAQDSSPESAFWSASSAVSPSACASAASGSSGSPSSPTSSVSVSISSSAGSSVGGVIVTSTVSSGSSRSVTPSGGVSAESVTVSFISRPETSKTIESGMSPGSASMLSSRVSWLSTPPSAAPGASSAPVSSSRTVVWIVSAMLTRSRSTCTASPRTGWRCRSLTSTGTPLPPSMDTSRIAPECASVLRRMRASTAKCCGSPPSP